MILAQGDPLQTSDLHNCKENKFALFTAAEFELIYTNLVAQRLKRLPGMQETQVRSLGREDPLEKEMAPTPVFLPGESHGGRNLVGYSPWGRKESDTTERLHFHFQISG